MVENKFHKNESRSEDECRVMIKMKEKHRFGENKIGQLKVTKKR